MKFKRFISVFLLCTCLAGLFLTPAAGALEVPDIQARAALLAEGMAPSSGSIGLRISFSPSAGVEK